MFTYWCAPLHYYRMSLICLIWLLSSFVLASHQAPPLNELWYEPFVPGKQALPDAHKELIMRSKLTNRKVMSSSTRSYLESMLWLRSTKKIARAKDIYDYWKLASTIKPLPSAHTKVGELLQKLMATLFWHRLGRLTSLHSLDISKIAVYIFPELIMCLTEYSPDKIKKNITVDDLYTLFNSVKNDEVNYFGRHALYSWMVLIGLPKSRHKSTALCQTFILTLFANHNASDTTVQGAISSLVRKIQTLKESCLLRSFSFKEFTKALKDYLLFTTWMITAMVKSQEVYELEARVRTLDSTSYKKG